MPNRCIIIILILILIAVFSATAWETKLTIDAGRPHQLSLGMEPAATDGIDKEHDVFTAEERDEVERILNPPAP